LPFFIVLLEKGLPVNVLICFSLIVLPGLSWLTLYRKQGPGDMLSADEVQRDRTIRDRPYQFDYQYILSAVTCYDLFAANIKKAKPYEFGVFVHVSAENGATE
jgi:hypothetical protein